LDATPYQPQRSQGQSRELKHHALGSVKPSENQVVDVDLTGRLSDPRIEEFEAEVARLRQQLLDQQQEAQIKLQEAILASRLEAQRQFQRDDAARTHALVQAAKQALAQQAQHLQNLESEAVRIAFTALRPVFGEAVGISEQVVAMIQYQVSLLQERSVVEVRLSADDELDLDAVVKALHANAQPEALVVVDPGLPKGSVRIGMRLGHVRLDFHDYAKAVREILQEIVDVHAYEPNNAGALA
jgi:hypothetical protein